MRKTLSIFALIPLVVAGFFAWDAWRPNSLYRVPHLQATELVEQNSSEQSILENLGEPYLRIANNHGGETFVYRTVLDLGKWQQYHRLRIDIDGGGKIVETEVWEEKR